MSALFSFEIANWKKHQERSDRFNFSWFKLQSDFFIDERVVELSTISKVLFIYMLCLRSRKKHSVCTLSIRTSAHLLGTTAEKLSSAFNELAKLGLITRAQTAQCRHGPVMGPPRGEERREENTAHCVGELGIDEELEKVYALYPRKLGKRRGMQLLRKLPLTEIPRLRLAAENLKRLVAQEGRELTKVPYFSTFANSWQDYLEIFAEQTPRSERKVFNPDTGQYEPLPEEAAS